jgi:hypothetical protein
MQACAQRRQYSGKLVQADWSRMGLDLGDAGLLDAYQETQLRLRQPKALAQSPQM